MKTKFSYETEFEPEDMIKLFDVGVILGKKIMKLITDGFDTDEESEEEPEENGDKKDLITRVKDIETRFDGLEAMVKEVREATVKKTSSKTK